jgi:hypothetical protein
MVRAVLVGSIVAVGVGDSCNDCISALAVIFRPLEWECEP